MNRSTLMLMHMSLTLTVLRDSPRQCTDAARSAVSERASRAVEDECEEKPNSSNAKSPQLHDMDAYEHPTAALRPLPRIYVRALGQPLLPPGMPMDLRS